MRINKKKGVILALVGMLLLLAGCCDHVWADANCTSPKTCTECGATRGDVVHQWRDATCTSPKICTECGVVEGDVTHTFEMISCTEPTVCSSCGETGEVIGHDWADASCVVPRSCIVCGETEGEPLGHTTSRGECDRCGEIVNDGVYAPLNNADCQIKSASYVKAAFETAGFSNVEVRKVDYAFDNGEYKDGEIIEVLINGVEVDTNIKYEDKDLVQIFYARVPFAREVTFGTYEQDNNSSTKDSIVWYVLATEGNKSLLVSKQILDYLPFNDTTIATGTSWGNSTLRKWLNGTFYDNAFTQAEKNLIYKTSVQDYEADKKMGDTTTDKVFILSYDEAWTYFTTNANRAADLTMYAKTRNKIDSDTWWLINSYSSNSYKYVVNADGQHENSPRVNESEGVRPAIWVDNSVLD